MTDSQRSHHVRVDFADSLQPMWIMYTCFAACGLLTAFFIKRKALTHQHEETKTGLEAEKENAAVRAAEKLAKRQGKTNSQLQTPPQEASVSGGAPDLEKAGLQTQS